MRVVVVGASGNVGTSVLHALASDASVDSALGVARRLPALSFRRTCGAAADIARDPREPLFSGADAVVHLAWLIQPSRKLDVTRATNVDGSARVFRAAGKAGARTLIYSSSVGAYSPGPKDRAVGESWPTGGIRTSFYSRHKAEVESVLDDFEQRHDAVRVVRIRPGLVFKRAAASEIRRLFAGPLLPSFLLHPRLIPVVPTTPRLRFQAVHSHDVGEAFRLALHAEVRGAFNLAAEPVIDGGE